MSAAVNVDEGLRGRLIFYAGVGISLWHLYLNLFSTMSELHAAAIHFASFGVLAALLSPHLRLTLALLIGGLCLVSGFYLIPAEQPLYDRGLEFIWSDWVFSGLAILLALELVRRTAGLFIPVVVIVALAYIVWWGSFVPGVMQFPGLSLETVLFRSYFGSDGMFGPIARISLTFVFMFILFGAFLLRSGAGDFVIRLAQAAAGKVRGGPGYVAVIASALTGTVSGSAVANTVSTGVITIPMMQRAGFRSRFAAGVEAAASTGGQLMPPIMGAGAFVMASYTQLPYLQIVTVSVLPAILYFLSVIFFIRIEAKKHDLAVEQDQESEPWPMILRRGISFIVPITVLIALLIAGFTPTYAAGIAILAVIASSWLTPVRMGPQAVLEALALGARNMATTAMLLVAIGLVVNVVATTGVGTTFSLMINDWAGGNLLLALGLIALASLVLGTGLPVTASYIVLATLSAPALYQLIAGSQLVELVASGELPQAAKDVLVAAQPSLAEALSTAMPVTEAEALLQGLPSHLTGLVIERALAPGLLAAALLSAHMVIFWLSQDSNVTPPVCIVAFAAAAIAKTRPLATGFTSWKVAKGLYLIPVLFAYTPILSGDWAAALQVFVFAGIALYALAGALDGYLEGPLGPLERILAAGIGIALIWPDTLMVNLVAVPVLFALALFSRRSRQPTTGSTVK